MFTVGDIVSEGNSATFRVDEVINATEVRISAWENCSGREKGYDYGIYEIDQFFLIESSPNNSLLLLP